MAPSHRFIDSLLGGFRFWRRWRGGHWEEAYGDMGVGPIWTRWRPDSCLCVTGLRSWPFLGNVCGEGNRPGRFERQA